MKIIAALASLSLLLAACGGGSEEDSTSTEATSTAEEAAEEPATSSAEPASTTPSVSESCSDVETFDVDSSGTHRNRDFSAADYATNPPTSGDHNPAPIRLGQFYEEPPRLGESVHGLEHGAVIGWTNGLTAADQKAVQNTFDAEFQKGYYQLAVIESPELEGSFALSSWDSLQRCEAVDPEAISTFVEEHYAPSTTAEGLLACTGKASKLPACRMGN